MRVVVDASAIAAIIYEEPDGATIRSHLQDDILLAPQLIDYELVNVGLVKIRRGLESEVLIRAMLSKLPSLQITREAVPTDEVIALALRTGLSGYDASYLWLAIARDLELVTLDRRLAGVNRALRGDPS